MAIRIEIQLVILCLFLMKSTVQCWSSYDHNVRHHHHRSRNTNNIVYKQLTKVNKQQFHGFIETTTTSNVSNQLITNVHKQQQIFPCDNLICLLETFELPTENWVWVPLEWTTDFKWKSSELWLQMFRF